MVKKVKKEESQAKIKTGVSVDKKLGVVKYKITKNKTLSTSHKKTNKKWIVIDATNAICGRLGAYIVINCDKIKFSGKKEIQKLYRDHSNYVGNVRIRTAREVREGKRPTDLLRTTVARMLGRSRMNYKLVAKNLYLYTGSEHKQVAQRPEVVDFAKLNRKNVVE